MKIQRRTCISTRVTTNIKGLLINSDAVYVSSVGRALGRCSLDAVALWFYVG